MQCIHAHNYYTKTFGERSFSYAGPSVWNNLPQTFRHSDSTSSFKAALKTHLFNNYFLNCFSQPCPSLRPTWACACTRVRACARARTCVCVCVIVKRPVLPPSVVDGRSRNPLYYYYYIIARNPLIMNQHTREVISARSTWHKYTCVCVCVIVKRPVLPPSVVDGRSRNPLYYYYYIIARNPLIMNQHTREVISARSTWHKYNNKDLSGLR